MGRLVLGMVVVGLVVASSGAAVADDRAEIERSLASKGLVRAGSAFVLGSEGEVLRRLGSLQELVVQNRAAVRRRQLRSGIVSGSSSLYIGLQSQQIALNALAAGGPDPFNPVSGNLHVLSTPETRQANLIGPSLEGKTVVMFDDMISTAGTLVGAAHVARAAGAREIYACATHAVLCGQAISNLRDAPLKQIVVTDTIPLTPEKQLRTSRC